MRLAVVQMNSGAHRDENVGRACRFIDAAAEGGADLVTIPEFFNIQYPFRRQSNDIFDLAESMDGPSITEVRAAASRNRLNLIATIYEKVREGFFFDTAFIINREGEIVGQYSKVHPAGPTLASLERMYYRGGTQFPVFELDQWKVGVSICYDWRFPETIRCLTINGAELVVMPFASPFTDIWPKGVPFRAWENSIYTATCNHVGQEDVVLFPGDSMISDPGGNILARAGAKEEIIFADLSRDEVTRAHRNNGVFRDRRPELYAALTAPMDKLPHI